MRLVQRRTINFVVDTKGWVQHRRVSHLRSHQRVYDFRVFTQNQFMFCWTLGMLRKQPVMFASWRIVHKIMKKWPSFFTDKDFSWFLGSVTSHQNIGGGLDPLQPIPNRSPEEAYYLATELLRRFKVVTVNSRLLYKLLEPSLPNIMYCPNGVDVDFFTPVKESALNNSSLRIGWVGKCRGAKNFTVVQMVADQLLKTGIDVRLVVVDKDIQHVPFDSQQMREFYNDIDYYLCASWNEGTPNPALEAGACGVPVITTRVGNMPELILDGVNGYLVDPTVESIVKRIVNLKTTPEETYWAMSRAIRKSVATDWSWNRNIQYHIDAFDQLLS